MMGHEPTVQSVVPRRMRLIRGFAYVLALGTAGSLAVGLASGVRQARSVAQQSVIT
jgi:hypothetical protein